MEKNSFKIYDCFQLKNKFSGSTVSVTIENFIEKQKIPFKFDRENNTLSYVGDLVVTDTYDPYIIEIVLNHLRRIFQYAVIESFYCEDTVPFLEYFFGFKIAGSICIVSRDDYCFIKASWTDKDNGGQVTTLEQKWSSEL